MRIQPETICVLVAALICAFAFDSETMDAIAVFLSVVSGGYEFSISLAAT